MRACKQETETDRQTEMGRGGEEMKLFEGRNLKKKIQRLTLAHTNNNLISMINPCMSFKNCSCICVRKILKFSEPYENNKIYNFFFLKLTVLNSIWQTCLTFTVCSSVWSFAASLVYFIISSFKCLL